MGRVEAQAEAQRAQTTLVKALDIVYGSTMILMAVTATTHAIAGEIRPHTAFALWGMLVLNMAWSRLVFPHDRVRSDFWRAIVGLPFCIYLYAAEPDGMFAHFWLPSFMQGVGACLSLGIGTRRLRSSLPMAVVFSSAVFFAGELDTDSLYNAVGILLGGVVLSIVAVHLGRTLIDATEQRDEARSQRAQLAARTTELTTAIEDLHREMEARIRLEAELAQAQKLESVGRLAAGVAHEINTPVQFVGDSLHFVREGMTELLEIAQRTAPSVHGTIDVPYLADELPKAIALAEDGLGRVATIVRSMKLFAHPDGEAMVPSDLNRAIEATLIIAQNEYRFVADLVTEFDPDVPLVECYIGELNQAVLNIVTNAAHAIAEQPARGRITVRTRLEHDHVVVAIQDTGAGIPDSVRGRIFEPFFTTKSVGKGTGQGLAIAHAVVEKHHGKLWFDSELGRGTTFFLRLPLVTSVAAAA